MNTVFVLTSIVLDQDCESHEELYAIFTTFEKAMTFIKEKFPNKNIIKSGTWHGLSSWHIGDDLGYDLREQKLNQEVCW